jgi:hypothetical protein
VYNRYSIGISFEYEDDFQETINDETLNDIQDYFEYEVGNIVGVFNVKVKVIPK